MLIFSLGISSFASLVCFRGTCHELQKSMLLLLTRNSCRWCIKKGSLSGTISEDEVVITRDLDRDQTQNQKEWWWLPDLEKNILIALSLLLAWWRYWPTWKLMCPLWTKVLFLKVVSLILPGLYLVIFSKYVFGYMTFYSCCRFLAKVISFFGRSYLRFTISTFSMGQWWCLPLFFPSTALSDLL